MQVCALVWHMDRPDAVLAEYWPRPAEPEIDALPCAQDMVAHSACDYGENMAEKEALAKYREYAWMGRVEKLRFSSAQLRREGKCPLTPEEAGLFLAALGFRPSTPLYIATYQVLPLGAGPPLPERKRLAPG